MEMTFREWYESSCGDEWHEDYADVNGPEMLEKYDCYCAREEIIPVYDG